MAEPDSRIENLYLSPGLAGRTGFYSEADRSVIGTIRCGVLFVMAFWSGPAMQAFAKLKHVLEAADPQERLELVVMDADGCPEIYDLFLSCSAARGCGGNGLGPRRAGHSHIRTGISPRVLRALHTREVLKECLSAPATSSVGRG